MILKLPYRPFKKLPYITEREVDIVLRIGTLEDVCEELDIDFWQIKDFMKENDFDFSHLLLWHGYLTACKLRYEKPKFVKSQSLLWYTHMSKPEIEKYRTEISNLFGKIIKTYKPDKKKVEEKQPLMN